MKIKALQCVWAIVENGFNVTAAAERLYLSQPAVSKQIKALEDRLGSPVFRRQNKQLTGLTDLGLSLLPEIEVILGAVQRIHELGRGQEAWQEWTLAAAPLLAHHVLSAFLPAWQSAFPQQTLHLLEGHNAQLIQMLLEREADLILFSSSQIRQEALPWRQVQVLALQTWRPRLLLPRHHPLAQQGLQSLEALHQQPLLNGIHSPRESQTWLNQWREQGVVPRLLLTTRHSETLKNYVRQGLGLGLIADFAYPHEDDDLCTLDLSAYLPEQSMYLIWLQELRLRPAHEWFMQQLRPDVTRENIVRSCLRFEVDDWTI